MYFCQLYDTENATGKKDAIKKYSKFINRFLQESTYAGSDIAYIRNRYKQYTESIQFADKNVVTFLQRQKINHIVREEEYARLQLCIASG